MNIDYIIETYCINKDKPELQCNGKCHLSEKLQIVSSEKNDTQSKGVTNAISESFFPVYFQSESTYAIDTTLFNTTGLQNFNYSKNYNYSIALQLLKPPIS
ncbi:hypothetical protein [Aequorivita sp. Q41]|uniref:hypothetical protein n=1 Tax=Aequorivita sp. Q41 TaxID=3153300 RepID=UPI003242195A